MNEFSFILVWIAVFAVLMIFFPFSKPEVVMGATRMRWGVVSALVLFFPIFHLAAYGPAFGDTGVYLYNFEKVPATWGELIPYVERVNSGKGFVLFEGALKIFFGSDKNILLVALALIHSLVVVFLYRTYSDNYLLSIYLFVASTCHISWMMNGRRQFLAAVIIYAATPIMIRKKYVWSVCIILLASLIHTSALIMLPVVFIVTGKSWNRRTLLFIIAAAIATYVLGKNPVLMDIFLEGTEYEGTMQLYQSVGDNGANPIRVLVNAVPLLIALRGRDRVRWDDDPILNFCINMSVINLGFFLVAMVTSGIMVGRLPGYTNLYNYILLPNILPKVFDRDAEGQVIFVMVFLYLIYFWISGGAG